MFGRFINIILFLYHAAEGGQVYQIFTGASDVGEFTILVYECGKLGATRNPRRSIGAAVSLRDSSLLPPQRILSLDGLR